MRKCWLVLVSLALIFAGAANAEDPSPAQEAQQYRRAIYHSIVWNFKPMSEMARGKRAFDVKEAQRRSLGVAYLATLLNEGFPKGSGSAAGTTDALDLIWEDSADFAQKLKALQLESNELRKVTLKGDEAAFVEQFKKLAGTCKDCHDRYKAD